MKQGDIVIMPFPFTDMSDAKIRPALIISNHKFNVKKNVLVVAISTQKGISDFSITLLQDDLNEGSLNKNSFIRLQNIFAVEKRLLIKSVARLNDLKIKEITQKIKEYL